MNHPENLPVLTLKHSPQREDQAARPQPVCVLRRRHSQIQCLVYIKHPRRPTYLGTRADPSTINEHVQYNTRTSGSPGAQHAKPLRKRHSAADNHP